MERLNTHRMNAVSSPESDEVAPFGRFSAPVTGAQNQRSWLLPTNVLPSRVELHHPKGGSGGGDQREQPLRGLRNPACPPPLRGRP